MFLAEIKLWQKCLYAIVASLITMSLGVQQAVAAQTDWINEATEYSAEPLVSDEYEYPPEYHSLGSLKTVPIIWIDGKVHMREAYETRAGSSRVAYVPQLDQWFIAFDSDTAYKYITGGKMAWLGFWAVHDGRKVVIKHKEGWGDGYRVAIVKDLQPYMKSGSNETFPYYEFQTENLPYWLQYEDMEGQKHSATIHSMTFSKNMRYGVFWLNWRQFVRVDFTHPDNEAIGFINRSGTWYGGIYNSRASAITNDGKYVFMDDGQSVVSVNAACGTIVTTESYRTKGIEIDYPSCQERLLDPTHVTGYDARHTSFVLAENERSFTYILSTYPYTTGSNLYTTMKVMVRLYDAPGIKYLALGDSFSSGEGNLNNSDKGLPSYRWGTNIEGNKTVPKEKCRISEVSYPYLLAQRMQYGEPAIGRDMTWASVACSGARIVDIQGNESDKYEGQDNEEGVPRLKGFDVKKMKEESLAQMIPGRHKQIEFIKQYQPKSVSVSVGGNDVEFGKVIRACVQPLGSGSEWTSTCSYANDDSKKANIAHTVFAMRNKLIDMYEEIIAAGPKSMKLYVTGYPIFINAQTSNLRCGLSVRLNQAEREMIVESTKLLNMIARSAADQAGAIFIDMESSLGNHVLCGTASPGGVNGVVLNDSQASFHPNPFGHNLMSERVYSALNGEPMDTYICRDSEYVTCPGGDHPYVEVPSYFSNAINRYSKSLHSNNLVHNIASLPGSLVIKIVDYTVGANNPINILLYSDKFHLGTYYANQSGGLEVEVPLPDKISYGYHTLEVEFKDGNGDPVKLWKIIEIRSGIPNDYDGDGIPNDIDENQYGVVDPASVNKPQPDRTQDRFIHDKPFESKRVDWLNREIGAASTTFTFDRINSNGDLGAGNVDLNTQPTAHREGGHIGRDLLIWFSSLGILAVAGILVIRRVRKSG